MIPIVFHSAGLSVTWLPAEQYDRAGEASSGRLRISPTVSSSLQEFVTFQVLARLSVFNGESSCMSVSALLHQILKPERSRNSQVLGKFGITMNIGKMSAL